MSVCRIIVSYNVVLPRDEALDELDFLLPPNWDNQPDTSFELEQHYDNETICLTDIFTGPFSSSNNALEEIIGSYNFYIESGSICNLSYRVE